MKFEEINSNILLGRLLNNRTISGTDWINLVPMWINDAIADMKISLVTEINHQDLFIENNMVEIPCNINLLVGVAYKNMRMTRTDSYDDDVLDSELYKLPISVYKYNIIRNKFISTNIDNDYLRVYFKQLSYTRDNETGVNFPNIPSSDLLLAAIEDFILIKLINRGHSVSGTNVSAINPALNPYYAYHGHRGYGIVGSRKKAMNDLCNIDEEVLEEIYQLNTSLLKQSNYNKLVL